MFRRVDQEVGWLNLCRNRYFAYYLTLNYILTRPIADIVII